ncbi:MAG: hypothetical protein OXC31_26130, partial [Spirochaetaceae bacterium]|nr:hypothetical protein [Spirochaetaceae bacterium]
MNVQRVGRALAAALLIAATAHAGAQLTLPPEPVIPDVPVPTLPDAPAKLRALREPRRLPAGVYGQIVVPPVPLLPAPPARLDMGRDP